MARYQVELPRETIAQFEKLAKDIDKMLGEMTQAGAEVAARNMRAGAPPYLKNAVAITRPYKTPTDDGVATKVYIKKGYRPFRPPRKTFSRRNKQGGKMYTDTIGVPYEFLAMVNEYGRRGAPFPKKPFIRKAFKKAQITQAMQAVERKYIPDV